MAKIRRFFCALAALAVLAAGAFAQSAPASPPALTREDLEAWLDAFVPRALQQGDIAGLAVAVVKDGQVLLEKGYGLADVRGKVPVNAGTVMRVASLSKAFTATAVMELVEQGKISLDQDINEYLDADRTRRSSDNAQRLTVVSACGMVGMVATGFLGMNIFEHHNLETWQKFAVFFAVFIPAIALTAWTVWISRRLATFMEALASERMTWSEKKEAFRQIWFSAKSAKGKRIAPGEVPAQPRPPAGEPAHSAD